MVRVAVECPLYPSWLDLVRRKTVDCHQGLSGLSDPCRCCGFCCPARDVFRHPTRAKAKTLRGSADGRTRHTQPTSERSDGDAFTDATAQSREINSGRRSAQSSPAALRGSQARPRPLSDHRQLVLGESAPHLHEQPARGRACIEAIIKRDEGDSKGLKVAQECK